MLKKFKNIWFASFAFKTSKGIQTPPLKKYLKKYPRFKNEKTFNLQTYKIQDKILTKAQIMQAILVLDEDLSNKTLVA